MDLCEATYRITKNFPRREIFGLTAQMRRSAVSVPSNIGEGEGRLTWGERRLFLSNARGSLFELESQIIIANRVGYQPDPGILAELDGVRNVLDGYIHYVKKR